MRDEGGGGGGGGGGVKKSVTYFMDSPILIECDH